MNEPSDLVKAVRERLSKEDRKMLRTVQAPAEPEVYDDIFDRVIERLKHDWSPEP